MEETRPSRHEVQALLDHLENTNIQKTVLISICVVNGLPKTGNKPDLLLRITQAVNATFNDRDLPRFRFLRDSITTRIGGAPPSPSPHQSSGTFPQRLAPAANMSASAASRAGTAGFSEAAGINNWNNRYRAPPPPSSSSMQGFTFKKSPFFEVMHRVGQLKPCEAMEQHRATVTFHFKAPDDLWLQRTLADPTLKVMVLCAANNTGVQDISFPHQSELKVNGDDVKANLRGLKNKPGSTRPVDITHALRLNKPAASNQVDFTYALTRQRYYVGVYVCKTTPVSELVDKVAATGKRISKSSVITELTRQANDPDVVATSQVVSLKCPLSYMRLKTPVRGIGCTHIQCFDVLSYLQLQEQGPQWLCPICNKLATFEQLAIDEYMKDILAHTSGSVDQISIEPTGQWVNPDQLSQRTSQPGSPPGGKSQDRSQSFVLDDDDEIVQISNVSFASARAGSQRLPSQGVGTPKTAPPSVSSASYLGTPNFGTPSLATPKTTASPRQGSVSGKRPAAAVIDLTLSDDDEPAQPPTKRANYGFDGDYARHTPRWP